MRDLSEPVVTGEADVCQRLIEAHFSHVTPASSREAVALVEGLLFEDHSEFE